MSSFTLHKQHGLQAECERTKLSKEIFSNVSYLILYTIFMPAPDLAQSKIIKINLFANSCHKGLTLALYHIYVLCLLLPYTGNTSFKLPLGLQNLARKYFKM